MDILSKINASWNAGENKKIECEDGRIINIKDGVNHVLAKANAIESDRNKSKTIVNDREAENEIGSK